MVLSFVIPVFMVVLFVTQHIWHWIPTGGLLWTLIGACLVVWAFSLPFGPYSSRRRRLGRSQVVCVRCGEVTTLARWMAAGRCTACRHDAYEYLTPGMDPSRYVQPVEDDETPLPRAKAYPVGRRLSAQELATARVGVGAQRRVRQRLTELRAVDGSRRI